MSQEVVKLKVSDLVLWTENPRDPIIHTAKDQDIVDKALADKSSKWTLAKLAREMGDYYDFSELPTVVMHGTKPIVYDGNRRIILAKLKHNLVTYKGAEKINIPDIPLEIPCNVCTKDIALTNVFRKHSDSGSWDPLERDIFSHKFMKKDKSAFLILEETTGFISANPHLNQRFVKDEIFRDDLLSQIGFEIKDDKLRSIHNDNETAAILNDISEKVKDKKITTRINRGKVFDVLDKSSQKLISKNKDNHYHIVKVSKFTTPEKTIRQTRRHTNQPQEIFGGKLYLKNGIPNSVYRDICDLYGFYIKNKNTLSGSFPSIIRMSLRLLCESAAKDSNKLLSDYLSTHFANAKKALTQDVKTSMANYNVNEQSFPQLLHTGAHNYQASSNVEQMIIMSIVIGEILKLSHGKQEKNER